MKIYCLRILFTTKEKAMIDFQPKLIYLHTFIDDLRFSVSGN